MLLKVVHHYHEFVPDGIIKEPWNAISSLCFFIPVIYWLYVLRGRYKDYWVLVAILPLIFLNGVGSTLFHAFGGGRIYGLLDALPPLVMMLFLATYFWQRILSNWIFSIAIVGAFLVFNFTTSFLLRSKGIYAMNIYYFINAVMVVLPVFLALKKQHWRGLRWILLTLVFIGLAYICRQLDYPSPNYIPDILPQGTHFLWHVFSAVAIFPLGRFLLREKYYEI